MSNTLGAQQARTDVEVALVANRLRHDIISMLAEAGSGHPGGSLSAADIMATLFFANVLSYNPDDPNDPDRDRFILCKGHAAPALYAVLAEIGYIPREELATLRKLGSRLQGHPDCHCAPGIEVSTGSLGQGLSIASGLALAFKQDAAHAGEDAPAKRVYALTGDGELQEGQNWEAFMFAAHRGLDNLCAVIDLNNLQIDGHVTDVCSLGDLCGKLKAFGWHVVEVNGHSIPELRAAFAEAAETTGAPTAVVAHTVKGKGVSFMEDACNWHGNAPSAEQAAQALAELDEAQAALAAACKEA